MIPMFGLLFVLFLGACSSSSREENNSTPDQPDTMPEYVWGVDSASIVEEDFYACIRDNFGEPAAFGRYLGTKEGVSFGLSSEEVAFLHERDIKIIPIYNHFTDARGYENAVAEAEVAIAYAQEIGIPEGVYIYADIEPSYPVDSAFLLGWYETIKASSYNVGYYGIFAPGENLSAAYEEFLTNIEDPSGISIWHSSSPYIGVTSKQNAPEFQPEVPEFVPVQIWQYGIDAETCNIDTNLIQSSLLDSLW